MSMTFLFSAFFLVSIAFAKSPTNPRVIFNIFFKEYILLKINHEIRCVVLHNKVGDEDDEYSFYALRFSVYFSRALPIPSLG